MQCILKMLTADHTAVKFNNKEKRFFLLFIRIVTLEALFHTLSSYYHEGTFIWL